MGATDSPATKRAERPAGVEGLTGAATPHAAPVTART